MLRVLLVFLTALCMTAQAELSNHELNVQESSNQKLSNQLNNHPSPYLAMHGNDPVAWQSWSQEVLKRAKQENKLIFVSIGYFSCHWCHVMQRESYQDKEVAKRLNSGFIPVKVDRELNPALDAYLIEFVQTTRGYAGWPLNVFLTPEGHPVVGIVYLPKNQFSSLLLQLDGLWQQKNQYIRQKAAQAAAQLKGETLSANVGLERGLGAVLHSQLLQQIMQAADEMQGGFGDQAKFPMVAQLNYLLASYKRQPLETIGYFLQLTLEHMATQGLRDHIGGGFFRYTVDPDWQTPHFEKMLYDNAQLSSLYIEAAKIFKREDFAVIGREALDFMLRELSSETGGMFSSLSAVDTNNVEGGYYLWSTELLKKMLSGKEFETVALLWGMEQAPHFDAGYLPKYIVAPDDVAKKLGLPVGEIMKTLGQARAKLFKARQNRAAPIDNKQLAAWNGLALSAFVKGAQLTNGEHYKQAAKRIRNYLVKKLWDGRRLSRALTQGREVAAAGLEDYAYAAQGLLRWSLLTNNSKDRQLARRWIDIAWQRFYTTTGWQLTDQQWLPGTFGSAVLDDNPMPSPSAVVIQTSLQLADMDGDAALKDKAMAALAVSQELLKKQPFDYANQIQIIAKLQAALTSNQ